MNDKKNIVPVEPAVDGEILPPLPIAGEYIPAGAPVYLKDGKWYHLKPEDGVTIDAETTSPRQQ